MPCEGYDEDSDDYDETSDAEIIERHVMGDYDERMKWHEQTHKDSADDKTEEQYWAEQKQMHKDSATRSGRVYNRWADEGQQNLRALERLNRGSESVDEYQLEELREKKKRSGSADREYTPPSDDDSDEDEE